MTQIPDLSKVTRNGQTPPIPEPEAAPTGPVNVVTAFVVIITENGDVVVSGDTSQALLVRREATPDDIYGAASLICKDVVVQQTAGLVQHTLMQMGQLAQQQAQSAQIRSNLNLR